MTADTDASTAAALDRLSARLDALEQRLDGALAPRGADPQAPHALADRLARLEAAIDAFGTLAQRLPTVADAAASGASWAWQQAEQRGVDPIAAASGAGELALELARAENLALAKRLLAQRRSLELALAAADSIDPADLEAITGRAGPLTHALANLVRAPAFGKLVELGADPAALGTAQQATTALVEAKKAPIEPTGPFAALRKLGDPDVKRAIGFTLALAKRFGQLLA